MSPRRRPGPENYWTPHEPENWSPVKWFWPEIAPAFDTGKRALDTLERLGIHFDGVTPHTACEAGQIFKSYRDEGGPRRHLIPDFLIGAHPLYQCNGLAAVDRGYLRRYFPTLTLLAP